MSLRLVSKLPLTLSVARNARQQGAQRAADRVNPEGVERVVVTQPALDLVAHEERDAPASTPMIIAPVAST